MCKDVLEDDMRSNVAPAQVVAAPSTLEIEKVRFCSVDKEGGRGLSLLEGLS